MLYLYSMYDAGVGSVPVPSSRISINCLSNHTVYSPCDCVVIWLCILWAVRKVNQTTSKITRTDKFNVVSISGFYMVKKHEQ